MLWYMSFFGCEVDDVPLEVELCPWNHVYALARQHHSLSITVAVFQHDALTTSGRRRAAGTAESKWN
jgi:hypothetical protein